MSILPRTWVAALFAAFLCASCVDSREEIWLDPTGSGRTSITITIPTTVAALRGGPDGLRTLIHQLLSQSQTVSELRNEISSSGPNTIIHLSFRFGSASSLIESLEESARDARFPSGLRHILGQASIQTHGISLVAERRIDVSRAIPAARFLPATDPGNRLVTILHLPIRPRSHNATSTRDGGRTLVWDMPVTTALRAPQIQRVVIRPPAFLLASLLAALMVSTTLVIHILRKRRATPPSLPDQAPRKPM